MVAKQMVRCTDLSKSSLLIPNSCLAFKQFMRRISSIVTSNPTISSLVDQVQRLRMSFTLSILAWPSSTVTRRQSSTFHTENENLCQVRLGTWVSTHTWEESSLGEMIWRPWDTFSCTFSEAVYLGKVWKLPPTSKNTRKLVKRSKRLLSKTCAKTFQVRNIFPLCVSVIGANSYQRNSTNT